MKKRFLFGLLLTPVLLLVSLLWPAPALAADVTVAQHESFAFAAKEKVSYPWLPEWSYYAPHEQFFAEVSPISAFFDGQGRYTVVYEGYDKVHIARLNAQMKLEATVSIAKSMPMLGGVTTDGTHLYLVWGRNDDDAKGDVVVMRIGKYDLDGNLIKQINFTGKEQPDDPPDNYGLNTQYPFWYGNCSVAVQEGVLVCSYGRKMYNGHQSSHTVYVSTQNMTRLGYTAPYTSHSFDQQVLPVSTGILFADHGDAYERGFVITQVELEGFQIGEITPFHLREGVDRDHGYNETYARFGSIAEVSEGFVLVAASERTLSLAAAPANRGARKHFEPRDLFMQVFIKDFGYDARGSQLLSTPERRATGTQPSQSDNEYFLEPGVTDYGVKWLTDYKAPYYVENPKAVALEDGNILMLWEKRSADNDDYTTWCMIVSPGGSVVQAAQRVTGASVTPFEQPIYRGGYLYWTTSDGSATLTVHRLKPGASVKEPEATGLKINQSGSTVLDGGTIRLSATVLPVGAHAEVHWECDTFGLIVDNDGTVTAEKLGYGREHTVTAYTTDGKEKASVQVKVLYKLETPGSFAVTSAGYDRVKLSWKKVKGATGYAVYRAPSGSKSYERIKTITSGSTLTYTDTGLTAGKTYQYKVRAYCAANGENIYSSYTAVKSAAPKPAKPTASMASASYTSLKISWGKVSGATKYEIHRATSKSGKYTKVQETSATSYTHKSLKTGTTYYYKVRAYRLVNGKKVYSDNSAAVSAKPVPAAPGNGKAARASSTSIKVSWGKVSGASGYEIWRSTKKSSGYKLVKTVKTGKTGSYTNTKLKKKTTYYYKVRAYRTVSGKKVYGSYSSVKYAKT